jgi:hypothetical protein
LTRRLAKILPHVPALVVARKGDIRRVAIVVAMGIASELEEGAVAGKAG